MMAENGLARTQPWTGATLCGRVGCRQSDMSNVFARARLPPTWGLANLPDAGRGSTEASAPAPPPAQPVPALAAEAGPVLGEAPATWDAETLESAPEDARAVHGAAPLAEEAHAQARAAFAVPAGAAVQQAGRGAAAGRALAAGALRAIARQAQEPAVQGSQAPSRGSGAEQLATQSSGASAAARSGGRDGVEGAPNWAASGALLAALLPRAVAAPDTAAARAAAVLRDDTVASQPLRSETAAAAQAAAQRAAATQEVGDEEDDEHTLAVLELDRLLRLSERAAAKQTSRAAPAVFSVEPAGSAGSQAHAEQGMAASASAVLQQAQALFVSSLPGGARPAAPAATSPDPAQAQTLFRNVKPAGSRVEAGAVAPAALAAEQAPALFRNALPANSYAAGKAVPLKPRPAAPAPGDERARRANARVRFSLGREDVQDASPEALNSVPGWWASSGGAGLSSGDEALGHDARAGAQASGLSPGRRPGQQPGLLSLDRLPPRRRPRPPPQQQPPVQAAHEAFAPVHPGAEAGMPGTSAPSARARRRAPPGKPRDRGHRDGARRGTPPMADSLLAVWRAAGGLDDPEHGPSAPDAGAGRGLANGVDADAVNGHVNGNGDGGGRAADAELAAGVALLRGRFMGLDDGIAEALLKVPVLLSKVLGAAVCHADAITASPPLDQAARCSLAAGAGAKQVLSCLQSCARAAMWRQSGGRGRVPRAVRAGAAIWLGRRERVGRRVRPGRVERRVRRRGPGFL